MLKILKKFVTTDDHSIDPPISKELDEDQMSYKLAYGSSWEKFYNDAIKFISSQPSRTKNESKLIDKGTRNPPNSPQRTNDSEDDYYYNLSMQLAQGCRNEEQLCVNKKNQEDQFQDVDLYN